MSGGKVGRGHSPGDRKWGLGREVRENFLLALVHVDPDSEEDLFTCVIAWGSSTLAPGGMLSGWLGCANVVWETAQV